METEAAIIAEHCIGIQHLTTLWTLLASHLLLIHRLLGVFLLLEPLLRHLLITLLRHLLITLLGLHIDVGVIGIEVAGSSSIYLCHAAHSHLVLCIHAVLLTIGVLLVFVGTLHLVVVALLLELLLLLEDGLLVVHPGTCGT